MLISPHIITEIADVLRKKFHWSQWQISEVMDYIKETAAVVIPEKTVKVIKQDKADNRILECALEGKADYIISGDKKRLQALKEFRGIPIISPAEFLGSCLR